MAAMAAAAQLKVEPVLARPWVLLRNAMDTTHVPSWLQRSHLEFTEKLFCKGIHANPILVAQTLYKMKGQTPHVAFVGRSNVGKSTLLNMLLHRRPSPVPEHWSNSRKLHLPTAAPVSHTPGRTRHLFRFELGGTLTLVDLPGYGHAAKTPKEVKESWRELVDGYLLRVCKCAFQQHRLMTNADQLRLVVSLVDGRVGVKRSDEELWELLEERQRQLMVVLTKVDQCSPEVLNRTMAHVVSLLEMKKATFIWPYVHAVSGLHGHGVDELRASVSLVASDYAARKQSKKKGAHRRTSAFAGEGLLPACQRPELICYRERLNLNQAFGFQLHPSLCSFLRLFGMTWVYNFGSGNADGRAEMKNLLGGKGANLAEMASIGLPVPPGFTLTTEICTYYYQNDCQYPADLKEQVTNALALVETRTGRKFGDATNPLLVSVRSGARASMPGMMDTVLNLGLNDATAEALAKQSGDRRFAFDSYRRFVQMYSDVVLGIELHNFEKLLERSKKKRGVTQDHELQPKDLEQLVKDYKACVYLQLGEEFPEDPQQQLWGAVGAVFGSWMNQRAKTYRKLHDIPEEWGTAVNVQAMVFGNMGNDCATGVAFTRNPSNGAKDFYGEFLVNAQGEDVVAGIRTPQELTIKARKSHGSDLPSLEEVMPGIFRELENVRHQLENHYRDMQDIEFTIQQGKLYMLQTRTGKRTAHDAPCAFARLADADYDCGGRGAKFLLVICDSWFDSGQHSQLLGVRIGEAKNPGPSPWGSYVTRRKRKRKSTGQATSVAAGAPGISALFGQGFQQQVMQMMQSMMEAMMGKMMESFFGGGGHWASGATTVGSPAKGKGKHGQMKGPGGGSMGEPPGAASVSEGKGVKGKDADSAKGKPKGKDHGNVKGQDADYVKGKPKGQGKNGGGAGGGKQSSKGAKDDGGPGLTGAASSKGKGKGKNRGDVDTSAGGEWEVIAWHAKPAAFGCARLITGIEALETALEADEKILVQVPAEDFCEAASIMDGGCHSGSVLIKDGEACGVLDELQKKWPVSRQHVPGTMGGNPRLRRVWVCTFGSAASLAPALDFVKAPAPKRRRNEDTVVLRCTAWRAFAEAKDFQSMLKKPGQTARAWYTKVAPLCIQEFIDSWGWQSFGDDQVKGLIRLTKEAALTALRSSGCWANGFSLFFAALDWGQVDASEAPALLWIDMESGEEAKAYVQRVRKEAACHGLHCGGDRLAVRLDQLDPRILPQKAAWHLRGARQDWLCDDVEAVLSSAGFSRFSEVTIEAKLLRRGQPVWEFRGLRQDFRDFVPIELEAAEGDIEGDMVLEAARVQRRRKTGDAKVLPLERVAKFGSVDVAELVKKVAAPKRRSRFARSKDAAATTPLEDMDVDGEAVDDGTEVGQKRRQAEQGGGKGDSESSEPASKRVSKSVVLPEGAVAHSNDGGGDCLFHCLADVLSSVTKKRRGHRAVRASIAAWMESHVELLEPHWDHIAPDGSVATGSFVDYCKKIREAGSWAGWLELYAAGVAQDLNILLFCPEHTVKFPARNEQGHFAVFKYEGGHYEVVTMPEATIAQLWLAAETAKPAGGRGGGARSKASSLHLSEFGDDCSADAPVCTSSRRAASSLHLSAFSNHDSLPAVSTGGIQDGLALSEFASEGGTVNQGVRSRSCRSWPTPADLRSLSTAACERPVVLPPRRRLRSKSKQWLPLSALASESAGVAVSCEIQEPGSPVDEAPPQPQVPRPRKSKYRVDDVARWPCPLCPMVIESKSVSFLCKLRYSHCHRHHEGQGLPGARRVCLDVFRALGPEEPDDWRCPLCDWGLPQGTRGQITQAALATAKDQHRQAKHPGVSRKEYDGKLKVRGQRKAVHVMNVRVRRLNAFAAKRQRDGVASFVGWKSFTWPFVCNSMSKERRALCLKQAWCCVHCGFCTRVAVCRKSHVKLCSTWDRSKLVGQRARLWKSYAEAKKLEHGVDPVTLLQVFENADLAMGGAGQPS
ncbi:Pyruvate, phosphate dikinase [Symbiodinium microadriaticum]|uniref:Pyruvate, phosphate dikinase n=1 Tax=Symbiodinium microadriaticum TaxID=2951 RepID=A0A1Q9EBV9_SYMMI|nr:Pyruvate, phosphate dikinase [Symbiodinium microadriaticum]